MKNVLLTAFVLLVLSMVSSCKTENVINRKLDGTWDAVVFFGDAPSSNETVKMTFNPAPKGEGSGVIVVTEDNEVTSYGFSYFLKGERMTMIVDQDAYVFTIDEYSRKRITMTDTYGRVTLMEDRFWN